MQAHLQYALLRLLARGSNASQPNVKGLTTIELLVVLLIISVLSAIALPTYLDQLKTARESEARSTLGSIARAQQAYRLEAATYADSFESLQQAVASFDLVQEYYSYEILDATATEMSVAATPLTNEFGLDSFCVVLGPDGLDPSC